MKRQVAMMRQFGTYKVIHDDQGKWEYTVIYYYPELTDHGVVTRRMTMMHYHNLKSAMEFLAGVVREI